VSDFGKIWRGPWRERLGANAGVEVSGWDVMANEEGIVTRMRRRGSWRG
jgi:hypothetical protein